MTARFTERFPRVRGGSYRYPRFANEDTEAQSAQVTSPRSHGQEAAQPLGAPGFRLWSLML